MCGKYWRQTVACRRRSRSHDLICLASTRTASRLSSRDSAYRRTHIAICMLRGNGNVAGWYQNHHSVASAQIIFIIHVASRHVSHTHPIHTEALFDLPNPCSNCVSTRVMSKQAQVWSLSTCLQSRGQFIGHIRDTWLIHTHTCTSIGGNSCVCLGQQQMNYPCLLYTSPSPRD